MTEQTAEDHVSDHVEDRVPDPVESPDAPADEVVDADAGRSLNALAVIAVFVGVQLPGLAAWATTGTFSPIAPVLAALVGGVLVLILDRMTRATAAGYAAEQVDAHVAPAVERAAADARATAEQTAAQVSRSSAAVAARSRALMDDCFALIDRLEADEEDPERLRDLFSLDHLATRMSRTTDAMLMLTGGWPTRAVRGRPPVSECLRAAAGEVEDYGRVDLHVHDDIDVHGTAVGPLISLTAELLEWAMGQDPSRVALEGGRVTGGYRLQITLPSAAPGLVDQLERAVATAHGPAPETPGVLGPHLAARIADGMGGTIEAGHVTDAGTVIRIDLPEQALVHGVTPPVHRPRPTRSLVPASVLAADVAVVEADVSQTDAAELPTAQPVAAQPPTVQAPTPQVGVGQAVAQDADAPQVAAHADTTTAPTPTPRSTTPTGSWSYSGYVDGTDDQAGSSRWALRGLRRRSRGADEPTAQPAPLAAAEAPTSAAAQATPLDDLLPSAGRAQQAAAIAAQQHPSAAVAGEAPPAPVADDPMSALAGLVEDQLDPAALLDPDDLIDAEGLLGHADLLGGADLDAQALLDAAHLTGAVAAQPDTDTDSTPLPTRRRQG